MSTIETRKLTRDVKNPNPDRRKRRAFCDAAEWPAGTVLRITDNGASREMCWPGGYTQYSIADHDPRYAFLIEASETIPLDNFDAVHDAYGHGTDYRAVCKALVMRRKVPLDDMSALIQSAASYNLYDEIGESEEEEEEEEEP